jgi:hypothetical protein
MPKAAVHEDNFPKPREDKVRTARKTRDVQTEPEPHSMNQTSDY